MRPVWLREEVGRLVGDMTGETTVRQVVYEMMEEFVEARTRLATMFD